MKKQEIRGKKPRLYLRRAQQQTILGMVNDILAKGEFGNGIDDPIERGETVIGELTPFERAIVVTAKGVVDKQHALVSEMGVAGDRSKKGEIVQLENDHELLRNLLWNSVRRRFGDKATDDMGIRAGFKLVSYEEKEESDGLGELLAAVMGKGLFSGHHRHDTFDGDDGGGGMGFSGEGLSPEEQAKKCSACSVHSDCPLPWRVARA